MPEPSRLVLLDQLSSLTAGTKVRFLACVHAYQNETATVVVKDRYPANDPNAPSAKVQIDAVLENVNHEQLQVGAWLNIIGLVRKAHRRPRASSGKPTKAPLIDAMMVWSAGPVVLDKYNDAVLEYQNSLPAD